MLSEQVDAIIVSYPANSIGAIQASNLVSKLQGKLTKTNADNLLKSFVARGWLTRSKRSRYSLSPRAIAELDNWLTSEYDDYMQKCGRCGKTVLSVSSCFLPCNRRRGNLEGCPIEPCAD